jgi:hypothetical protein
MAKRHANSSSEEQLPPNFIQICCAWGNKLVNGILTYQINGGDSVAQDAIHNAIANWNSKLTGLKLIEASAGGNNVAQPEIEINIVSKSLKVGSHRSVSSSFGKNFRVAIPGLSEDSFDSNGFLNHVKITLSTNAMGRSFDLSNIQQIAEHEIGHALGLGHANFHDLMFPVANFESSGISQCDVSAVLEANHLRPVGSDTAVSPQTPHLNYVGCG